jgi:hypothetical protein
MIEDLEPFEGEALLDAKCFKWAMSYLLFGHDKYFKILD